MNNFSVLVVDNDSTLVEGKGTDRDVAKSVYSRHASKNKCSAHVVEAATVAAGLEALAKESFDVVIAEVNFNPNDHDNKDGIEFLKAARAKGYQGRLVSYSGTSRFQKEALEAGANKFVGKTYIVMLIAGGEKEVIAEYASWLI